MLIRLNTLVNLAQKTSATKTSSWTSGRGTWSIGYLIWCASERMTFLATIFAMWHVSKPVPTPCQLKQWPGTTTQPLPVIYAMLILCKMSSMSSSTAPRDSLLFHCTLAAGISVSSHRFPWYV